MSIHRMTNPELLTLLATAIENSEGDPFIREAVAAYGYDEKAFAEGRALLDQFEEGVGERTVRYGLQVSATAAFREAWKTVKRRTYMLHVIIARTVFHDEAVLAWLGLKGRRSRAFDAWLGEARHFYDTLLDDDVLIASMAERGAGRHVLEDARRAVEEVAALKRRQKEAMAAARQATERRDRHRRAAVRWLADYQKFARLALVDHPDLGEQLGLSAPS